MLFDPKNILRRLIAAGHIVIASRGHEFLSNGKTIKHYCVHEMPVKMRHIQRFEELVSGADWEDLLPNLKIIDEILDKYSAYVPWSPYDTSYGYVLFTRKLLKQLRERELPQRYTPASLGLGYSIDKENLISFLQEYLDKLESNPAHGPRDLWEKQTLIYSNDPDTIRNRDIFLNSSMRLANEIYHYNFGMGLMKAFGGKLFVETQPSAAFDELLYKPKISVERISDIKTPYIPSSIHKVSSDKFVKAMTSDEKFMSEINKYLSFLDKIEKDGKIELFEQADVINKYNSMILLKFRDELSAAGEDPVEVGISESLFPLKEFLPSIVAGGILYDTLGGVGAAGAAFLVHFMKKAAKPIVLKQYRLVYNDISSLSPAAAHKIQNTIQSLKRQKIPISLELDASFERALDGDLKLFSRS